MYIFFFFLIFLILLAALGLSCGTQDISLWHTGFSLVAARGLFSSSGERGLLFVAVCGLLNAVASLVAEHGL